MTTTHDKSDTKQAIFSALTAWLDEARETQLSTPAPDTVIGDARGLLVDALLDKDHKTLREAQEILTPWLCDTADLLEKDVGTPEGRAAIVDLGSMLATINTALFKLEVERPEEAIKHIPHGPVLLFALASLGQKPYSDAGLADKVRQSTHGAVDLTPAAIQRLVSALDQSGFLSQHSGFEVMARSGHLEASAVTLSSEGQKIAKDFANALLLHPRP